MSLTRRSIVRGGVAALAALSHVALPALAADTKVSSSAFSYSGFRYYRGKAENVKLGSYGEKKTPVGQINYLAVQNNITNDNLAKASVQIAGPFSIDWSKFSKTDVEASGSTKYVKAGGTASFSYETAKTANLKLVKFYLNEGSLKTLLNNYASGARNFLSGTGSDGRVVSEVWVVMEATIASQVVANGSVSGNATVNGINVDVKAGGSVTTAYSITLPPDTSFAYLLHKVKSWNSGKTLITDLEDDQHGVF